MLALRRKLPVLRQRGCARLAVQQAVIQSASRTWIPASPFIHGCLSGWVRGRRPAVGRHTVVTNDDQWRRGPRGQTACDLQVIQPYR